MRFKFYLTSLFLFCSLSLGGFFVGAKFIIELLIKFYGKPYGEEFLAFTVYSMVFSAISFIFGLVVAVVIIERLGRRWGSRLNFGSHPVLKLTGLSFLTFLGLLILLLFLYPTS